MVKGEGLREVRAVLMGNCQVAEKSEWKDTSLFLGTVRTPPDTRV